MGTFLGATPRPKGNTINARKSCLIVFALFVSVAYQVTIGEAEAAGFDDLSEQQKEAAIALLKQAMSETNVDPLEIIKHGIEKVKEEEKRGHETSSKVSLEDEDDSVTEVVPAESKAIERDTTTSSNFAELGDNYSTTATSLPGATPSSPNLISPNLSEHHVEEPSERDLVQPHTESNLSDKLDDLKNHELSQADEKEELAPAESTHIERSIESDHGSDPNPSELSIAQSDLTDKHRPHERVQDELASEVSNRQAELGKKPKIPMYSDDVVLPNKQPPAEEDFEDTFIDRSDPKNPKKVHIKKKNKSRVGPDGASHEQLESKVITSIGNNPNAYSRHSSSSSFSSSSSTGKRPGKNWVFDQMQRLPTLPSMPQIPPIPPMPPMPPMPLMPYGLPIAGAWPNYYGQGMEDYNEGFAQPGAYATAMAGIPGAFYGYPPQNEGYVSKRRAKKQRRAARRAAREREFTY